MFPLLRHWPASTLVVVLVVLVSLHISPAASNSGSETRIAAAAEATPVARTAPSDRRPTWQPYGPAKVFPLPSGSAVRGATTPTIQRDRARAAVASGSWSALAGSPLSPRFLHTAVWTGSSLLVWGGTDGFFFYNDGARYRPDTNSWIPISQVGAPSPRTRATAVWTGSELIVWGGADPFGLVGDGARYNPNTDSWSPIAAAPLTPRLGHSAVWTGSRMIVWGGSDEGAPVGDGAAYNPGTDTWTPVSAIGAPSPRAEHTVVWTGAQMIIWGGAVSPTAVAGDGARYNPVSDSWTSISMTSAPSAREFATGVWTGSEVILWGGADAVSILNTGARYNPATDSWASTSQLLSARAFHTAVWTGERMLVWGGLDSNGQPLGDGAEYSPVSNTWDLLPTVNSLSPRAAHSANWTGTAMIVWGGGSLSAFGDGASYAPSTGTSAMLNGSVTLQGLAVGTSAYQVTLQVRLFQPGTTTLLAEFPATTDVNGNFVVSGIAPGTYDVEVKEGRRIARIARNLTLVAGPNTRAFGDLLAGDVNGDGAVSLVDYSRLRSSYGRCNGDTGYQPNADFTGDSCVTLPDYSRLRANYGAVGPLNAP